MNRVSIVSEKGKAAVTTITVIGEEGVERYVGIRVEPNTDGGWLVMPADKALDVAARLMAHAGVSHGGPR